VNSAVPEPFVVLILSIDTYICPLEIDIIYNKNKIVIY
jgi:hypothetical protein